MHLNEKTKAHYLTLANELNAAQRRLQDFLHGAALAMDVDPNTHNFDPQTTAFVAKAPAPAPAPQPEPVAVASTPTPALAKAHANGKPQRA